MKNRSALATALAGLCVLAGCSGRTDVSLTGNTPAQYSHVWITTQEVWFNTSAAAGPDAGGWRKFSLSTPATVDLVQENNGTLGSVVTGLNITPGTYAQIRLIPVDPSAVLTTSAQQAGAIHNAEADYVDASGTTHQLLLELLNPEKGIGIQASLRVPVGSVSAAVGAVAIGGGTTNSSMDASFVTPTTSPTGSITPTTTPTATATTTTGTTTTTPTVPTNQFAVSFDGARDLVPFSFTSAGGSGAPGAPNGIMLSSHAAAYDLTQVGAISGTLTLTNLTGISSESGAPAIEASAEVLSADGSRHVVVSSTPVHSDGTFMLYPLAASSGHIPDEYDVVIHGPGIATIIIKSVQLFQSSVTTPAAGTNTTTPNTTDTTGTTGTTGSTTTSTTSNTTITPVSIGTLVPRAAATPFSATLTSGATPLPSGAAASFYQTLQGSGEVPYVIETSPIDPFNQVMPFAQQLSTGTIDSGTWSSTGSNVTTVSAAPAEGAGHYQVAATAPSYADGALGTRVDPSATSFSLPPMALASGTAAGTVSATVTPATPRKYDAGELLLTHDGTLVASASLDAVLGGGGTVVLHDVPAGTASAVYYVTVRAWSTKDASIKVQRQSFPGALDLSSASSGLLQLTVN